MIKSRRIVSLIKESTRIRRASASLICIGLRSSATATPRHQRGELSCFG
ncbi:unnamed protein product [Rhodiola kirilowii]